jgi:hypothetical protein
MDLSTTGISIQVLRGLEKNTPKANIINYCYQMLHNGVSGCLLKTDKILLSSYIYLS